MVHIKTYPARNGDAFLIKTDGSHTPDKADIVIQDEHVIELKLGFTEDSVAEFDRCLGQLWRYKEKWVSKDRGRVWLVVVGHSEAEFRYLLQTWFNQANGAFFTWSPFEWLDKRPT